MLRVNMKVMELAIGEMNQDREPVTPENQAVIHSSQDIRYSGLVLNLSKPATLTLPEIGGRYMSAQVINQDHYSLCIPITQELNYLTRIYEAGPGFTTAAGPRL